MAKSTTIHSCADNNNHFAVADPGFPRGGGANSPGEGMPRYDFAKFSQKLHEIERIWTPGEGGASKILLCRDPPLLCTTQKKALVVF